ncbi:hypothetical protein [Amycolatopsis sp. Hca4]|uniref:hypothetical protein n=1 Tax=Amycolatopsis sp. Hca4 TaxID=2742131 RepID=UPI00159161FF|nr:hypothetical protein [Amycolatopsis sp. Hca4]QKV73991.1 hypothetical protein HUT10_09575 [Amycolatopsis sp. Hca4]
MGDLSNRIGRLDSEAEYAARTFDHANSRFENTRDEQEERELLRTVALALNALGNIRLAQAMLLNSND